MRRLRGGGIMADEQREKLRHGCCVDGSCDSYTCMALPEGVHCHDCRHLNRCVKLGFTWASATACDFFPRRFCPVDMVVTEGVQTT